jgi:hypothetical protein
MSDKEFPSWQDLPCRLNNHQLEHPLEVILEFFECFHLPDIRKDLLDLYDYSTGHEADNAKSLFFVYIEVEKLIEAVWVLKDGISKNNGEKYKLLSPVPPEILGKKPTPLELAKNEPTKVVFDIFEQYTLTEMRSWLKDWSFVATSGECNAYDEAESRKQLNILVNDLNSFFEAVYVINSQINTPIKQSTQDKIIDLSRDQVMNPKELISSFFKKFPITYLRRELCDWLQASISFTKPWPENFHVGNVCGTYNIFSCLIESAWMLMVNEN